MSSDHSSKGWKIFSWLCLLAGLYCLATLLLVMLAGGEWNYILTFNNPKKRMAGAWLALAAWYLTRQGIQKDPKVWARQIGQIILLSVSLAISFLAAEIFLRASLKKNQGDGSLKKLAEKQAGRNIELQSFHPLAAIVQLSPNKRLVYELMPNLDMKFGGRKFRTNNEGMRDDLNYAKNKTPGTIRIVGVGDSGMFGWNMEQGDEYLSVLRSNLQKRSGSAKYEVMNLAVPGYNTFQEVEMLRHRGLSYQPDVVVVGWCDNDAGAPFFLIQQDDFKRRDVSYLYHLLFNRKAFRDLVKPKVMKSSKIDRAYVDPQVLEYSDISGVKKSLAELKALGQTHGFKILLYGPMHKEARTLCEELGIDYANTWDEIPEGAYPKEYAVHFMHPLKGGHRVLGETLEKVLERKGWLEKTPDP
jgi:hypothetical protein